MVKFNLPSAPSKGSLKPQLNAKTQGGDKGVAPNLAGGPALGFFVGVGALIRKIG